MGITRSYQGNTESGKILNALISANAPKVLLPERGVVKGEKQVVAPKVTVTVAADGKWHEYADKK